MNDASEGQKEMEYRGEEGLYIGLESGDKQWGNLKEGKTILIGWKSG